MDICAGLLREKPLRALVKSEIARLTRIIQAARAKKTADQRSRRANKTFGANKSGKGPLDPTQRRRMLARSSLPQTNIRPMDPARFGPAACPHCERTA